MDRYREITTLPWRNPISGGPRRTYTTEILGGCFLCVFLVALVIAGFCL